MKTPVIKKKDYTIYFEDNEGYTFTHCDCYRWSKHVRDSLIKDVEALHTLHHEPVYALHETEDKKHLKFLTMLNFKLKTDIMCTDGVVRQIFERKV